MEPFIGEIILFAGNFAPKGWSFCNGQLLSIEVNAALYSILGTNFGGNGTTTFGLPDLRGRVPVHPGSGVGLTKRTLGETGGTETIVIRQDQLPVHSHVTSSTMDIPIVYEESARSFTASVLITRQSAKLWADSQSGQISTKVFEEVSTESSGKNQPVDHMPPFQCIHYIIALQGIYPART